MYVSLSVEYVFVKLFIGGKYEVID